MVKEETHQENINIINVYISDNKASKHKAKFDRIKNKIRQCHNYKRR